MTTTAHEDQFTPEADGAETAVYTLGQAICDARDKECEVIAAWLDRHGYREIAARIRAGEHLA